VSSALRRIRRGGHKGFPVTSALLSWTLFATIEEILAWQTPADLLVKSATSPVIRFVFGLIEVARDFDSEIETYTLLSGVLGYLFWTGMSRIEIIEN